MRSSKDVQVMKRTCSVRVLLSEETLYWNQCVYGIKNTHTHTTSNWNYKTQYLIFNEWTFLLLVQLHFLFCIVLFEYKLFSQSLCFGLICLLTIDGKLIFCVVLMLCAFSLCQCVEALWRPLAVSEVSAFVCLTGWAEPVDDVSSGGISLNTVE